MEQADGKNGTKVVGIIIAVIVVISAGLILLARGGNYQLTVLDPGVGPEDAPVLIEEFADFQCPACRANAPLIKAAIADFPTQVRFVYNDFPLSQHGQARSAAISALCAAQQGQFEAYHDSLYENQQVWAQGGSSAEDFFVKSATDLGLDRNDWQSCRDSRDAREAVQADVDEGFERGISSTPSFMVNGEIIENPVSVFAWVKLIEEQLEAKGITPENKAEVLDPVE